MRTVSIWASGLLASAIPFIFVGAVIVFGACNIVQQSDARRLGDEFTCQF
jgi:hypothetical protein